MSGAPSFIVIPSSVRVRTILVVVSGSVMARRPGAVIAVPSQ
jgi:hypothetical protein